MSGAIVHLIWLLFQVDGSSSMMSNLATIIKGLLTLGKGIKAMGPRSQPMKDNLGGGFIGTATTPMGPDPYITTSGVIPQIYTPVGMQGQG